ncbi:dihydroneopterin aldolase [Oryzibacter oryziterrae]|uniref:dihydroneopterin aldolase n=1 Tax=Oryzibacter oryziterrae TaxID=2766474 RepID=UPI001F00D290|nr:dihydroneopterin aldolase [Oryzibacter oryziterrae]
MTDKISVQRIAVFAYHGVFQEESKLGQRFYISFTAELDLKAAGQNDDLSKTVHYGEMTDVVVRVATMQRFRLIEGLAETIARELLEGFPLVDAITVKIEKPAAPVTHVIDTVSLEITRRRS